MSRSTRLIAVIAALACLSIVSAQAFATDDPPASPPAGTTGTTGAKTGTPPSGTTTPTAGTPAAGCKDVTKPKSRLGSTKTAAKTHKLTGTVSDSGACGTSATAAPRVSVAISRKSGAKCQFLSSRSKLSRATSCKKPRWINATSVKAKAKAKAKTTATSAKTTWTVRLPRKLPRGKYSILTRAVDSAGNVERAHTRRLAVR
jgi:hypothetical protein